MPNKQKTESQILQAQQEAGRVIADQLQAVLIKHSNAVPIEILLGAAAGLVVDVLSSAPESFRLKTTDRMCDMIRATIRESLT